MKKFLLLISLFIITNSVFAYECQNCKNKCMDLKTSMHNQKATLYNVLNLSDDQQKCKDTIDTKYKKEFENLFSKYEQEQFVLDNMKKHGASEKALSNQSKILKQVKKDIKNLKEKSDKEFYSILTSEQKTKYKTISKMEEKEESYCKNQKAYIKHDPNVRIFGENMYYGDNKKIVCPAHKKHHIFGKIHEEK